MSDLKQAYTGFKTAEPEGVRPGRFQPTTERTPRIPIHAAREGDEKALCGAAVVEVSDRPWPGMGACRACAREAKGTQAISTPVGVAAAVAAGRRTIAVLRNGIDPAMLADAGAVVDRTTIEAILDRDPRT